MASRKAKPRSLETATVGKWSAMPWLVQAFVLVAATFLVYSPAMNAGYFWDDRISLCDNPFVRASGGLRHFWLTSDAPDYWPLSATTFWIEWHIWGNNPTPYHVANILLHALAAVILWRVLTRLGISGLGAFLGSLLFAIHPVTVESVAWITERKTVLSMVLYLLSILSYLRFEDGGRRRWYVIALLSAVAALLAKTSTVALPIVLLLLTWWRHKTITKRDLIRTAPFFLVSLVLGLVTIWFQHHNAIAKEVVRPEGLASRIAAVGWVVWFYLYKIILPINLAVIYPRWKVNEANILSYVPLALLCVTLAVLWRCRRGWSRGVLLALTSFIIVLAPVLGLLDMAYSSYSLVADHLQYPGLPGILALVGSGMAAAWTWAQRNRHHALATSIAVTIVTCMIALGTLTWLQARIYENDTTAWTHTLEINDQAWAAYNNLGNASAHIGDHERAVRYYSKGIELKSDYAEAYNNRGNSYCSLQRYDLALADCSKAIEIKPRYAQAYSNRANTYNQMRDYIRAMADCEQALTLEPKLAMAYSTRGNTFGGMHRFEEAVKDFTKAIELDPDNATAYNNRGAAFNELKEYQKAVADFAQAIKIDPDFALAYNNRGTSHIGLQQFDQAVADYTQAIALRPTYAQAFNNRGMAFGQMGDHVRAVADFTKAIELAPDKAQPYYSRALAFYYLKEYEKSWADVAMCRQLGGQPNPDLVANLSKSTGRTQ